MCFCSVNAVAYYCYRYSYLFLSFRLFCLNTCICKNIYSIKLSKHKCTY